MSNRPKQPPLDKRTAGEDDATIKARLVRLETIVDMIQQTQESLQRRLDDSLQSFRVEMHEAIDGLRRDA